MIQVLGNLLSNAARYSTESTAIRVGAALEDGYVAITVSDKGRGLSAEQLPLLLRKLSRAGGDDSENDTTGSGLGLAICKGIVEAHDGRIWAESEGLGLGTRFTFTVPAVEGTAATVEVPGSGAAPTPKPRERARVLAVDDDPMVLRYLRDALTNAGYMPVITTDPDEALSLVETEPPELVLLDLMLPGRDGIELMRSLLGIADVPVVWLSAYGRDEIIARAFEAGAIDYMVKPFSPTERVARVRSAMLRRAALYTAYALVPPRSRSRSLPPTMTSFPRADDVVRRDASHQLVVVAGAKHRHVVGVGGIAVCHLYLKHVLLAAGQRGYRQRRPDARRTRIAGHRPGLPLSLVLDAPAGVRRRAAGIVPTQRHLPDRRLHFDIVRRGLGLLHVHAVCDAQASEMERRPVVAEQRQPHQGDLRLKHVGRQSRLSDPLVRQIQMLKLFQVFKHIFWQPVNVITAQAHIAQVLRAAEQANG